MASTKNVEIEESREPIRNLIHSSISNQASKLAMIEKVSNWRKKLIDYLENRTLPPKKRPAVQLRMKAKRFTMVNGMLYKRGFALPLLKCISLEEGNYVLQEIHEGICGIHSGVKVLAHKVVKAGFY